MNYLIGTISSVFLGPSVTFTAVRHIHLQHHKHTNVEGKDPDLFASSGPLFFLPFKWAMMGLFFFVFVFLFIFSFLSSPSFPFISFPFFSFIFHFLSNTPPTDAHYYTNILTPTCLKSLSTLSILSIGAQLGVQWFFLSSCIKAGYLQVFLFFLFIKAKGFATGQLRERRAAPNSERALSWILLNLPIYIS